MASKARAYASQARADFVAYEASGEAVAPALDEQHRLHLLQMALEKLGKAFLYYAEPDARYNHRIALSAINRLKTHAIAEACGMKLAEFIRMLEMAKPIFLAIEAAGPSIGADGRGLTREESERTANVEYPWQLDPQDPVSWIAPTSHEFPIIHQLRYDRRSYRSVRLLKRLIDAAEVILPKP